jgi:hypothetical protein
MSDTPQWLDATLVWWAALAALAGVAATVLLVWIARWLGRLDGRLASLDRLEHLERAVTRIGAERDDLDLKRLEHVLIDIRDGQRRVEDLLVAALERPLALALPGVVSDRTPAMAAVELADRVVTRLLALGYERVVLVSRQEELARFLADDGDVVVEARRDGAICKGRVQVRGGRISEIQIQPAYSAVP